MRCIGVDPATMSAPDHIGKAGRTALARSSAASNPGRVRFGSFELDEANSRLLRDGKALEKDRAAGVPVTAAELGMHS